MLKLARRTVSASATAPAATTHKAGFSFDPKEMDRILVKSTLNGVTTMRMNNPKKLNAWTGAMMIAIRNTMAQLASDDNTKAVILTGTGPYYCAGVNLSSTIKPMHPRLLRSLIVQNNQALFDSFLDFPKPIMVAANGPAIGASVTSATLCDAIIASESATFSTPFARLGIPPEGCSSVHFEKIMGKQNAERMLGPEGWMPTARQAKEAGFVLEVVASSDQLAPRAQALAEEWVRSGKRRSVAEQGLVQQYKEVNLKESNDLADAFLAAPFLHSQYQFLRSKGKTGPASLFWLLKTTRPLWSRML